MVWLTFILATIAAALVAFGYLFYLNPDPVTVQLSQSRQWQTPLSVVIFVAFLFGAAVTSVFSLARAGRNAFAGWRMERSRRRARRQQVRKDQGLGLSWLGELDKARSILAKALRDRPDDLAAFLLFARTYLEEGDFRRAASVLEEGLDTRGPDPKLLFFLAQAQRGLGELGAAIETLERARRADPRSPRVLAALRDTYVAAGRWPDAAGVQELHLLALRDPHAHAAGERRLTGLRYQSCLGEPDTALRATKLRRLLREQPDFAPAAVSLGDAMLELGQQRQAERVWRRGLARDTHCGLLERLERLLRAAPRVRRLDALTRRLVRRRPGDGTLRLFRARQLVRDGRLEDAAAELARVTAPWTSLPGYHALLAELHVRRGAHEDAVTAFRQALAAGALGVYRCEVCDAEVEEWRGLCVACGSWNSYRSSIELSACGAGDDAPVSLAESSPPSPAQPSAVRG